MVQRPACLQPGKLRYYWNEKATIILLKSYNFYQTDYLKPNNFIFLPEICLKTSPPTPQHKPHNFLTEKFHLEVRKLPTHRLTTRPAPSSSTL